MAIARFIVYFLIVVVFLAKINEARTFSNRLLRLRDENRGSQMGSNQYLRRRNSKNLWRVIGRSHYRREPGYDDIRLGKTRRSKNELGNIINDIDALRRDLKGLEKIGQKKRRLNKVLGHH